MCLLGHELSYIKAEAIDPGESPAIDWRPARLFAQCRFPFPPTSCDEYAV